MRFFKLSDDVTVPGRWNLDEVCSPDGDEPPLADGIHCPNGGLVAVVGQKGMALDFSLTSFGVPIARSRTAEAIAAVAGRDIQRLPVSVVGHSEPFEVINVLRVIDCIDEGRSEYLKWTGSDHRSDLAGQFRMVSKLKLSLTAIPADANVFRLAGWLVGLIVSERVRSEMEAVGCKGARFQDVT